VIFDGQGLDNQRRGLWRRYIVEGEQFLVEHAPLRWIRNLRPRQHLEVEGG
jgi:hypothetical protein